LNLKNLLDHSFSLQEKSLDFIYKGGRDEAPVDINENILKEAMEVAETETKKETITPAFEELIKPRLC